MMANTDTSQMIITGILATDNETRSSFVEVSNHQEFQVPKVQVLNLKKLFWWVGVFPYISCFHTAFIGGTVVRIPPFQVPTKSLEGSNLHLGSTHYFRLNLTSPVYIWQRILELTGIKRTQRTLTGEFWCFIFFWLDKTFVLWQERDIQKPSHHHPH